MLPRSPSSSNLFPSLQRYMTSTTTATTTLRIYADTPFVVESDLIRTFVDIPQSCFIQIQKAPQLIDELFEILVPVVHPQPRGIRATHPAVSSRRRSVGTLRVAGAARLRLAETADEREVASTADLIPLQMCLCNPFQRLSACLRADL